VPGFDTVKVQKIDKFGCIGKDLKTVSIGDYPKADFEFSLPGAQERVQFENTTKQPDILITDSIVEFTSTWWFGRNYVDSLPYVQPFDQVNDYINRDYHYGYYNVGLSVVNEFGCRDSINKEIFIDLKTGIFVPTAFSPTNPAFGVRYFQPVGYNFETCEVWVYDVWGNLVWYSNDVEDGIFVGRWDGTYNGEMLKSDTYIWKINAKFSDGSQWEGVRNKNGKASVFGNVFLIR